MSSGWHIALPTDRRKKGVPMQNDATAAYVWLTTWLMLTLFSILGVTVIAKNLNELLAAVRGNANPSDAPVVQMKSPPVVGSAQTQLNDGLTHALYVRELAIGRALSPIRRIESAGTV
jgi:hypothetical protein